VKVTEFVSYFDIIDNTIYFELRTFQRRSNALLQAVPYRDHRGDNLGVDLDEVLDDGGEIGVHVGSVAVEALATRVKGALWRRSTLSSAPEDC